SVHSVKFSLPSNWTTKAASAPVGMTTGFAKRNLVTALAPTLSTAIPEYSTRADDVLERFSMTGTPLLVGTTDTVTPGFVMPDGFDDAAGTLEKYRSTSVIAT